MTISLPNEDLYTDEDAKFDALYDWYHGDIDPFQWGVSFFSNREGHPEDLSVTLPQQLFSNDLAERVMNCISCISTPEKRSHGQNKILRFLVPRAASRKAEIAAKLVRQWFQWKHFRDFSGIQEVLELEGGKNGK